MHALTEVFFSSWDFLTHEKGRKNTSSVNAPWLKQLEVDAQQNHVHCFLGAPVGGKAPVAALFAVEPIHIHPCCHTEAEMQSICATFSGGEPTPAEVTDAGDSEMVQGYGLVAGAWASMRSC